MKKFRSESRLKITEIEVIRETEKQVIYLDERGKEQREAKESNWHKWHETKEEAKEYLTSVTNEKIESLIRQIEYNKKQLQRIEEL